MNSHDRGLRATTAPLQPAPIGIGPIPFNLTNFTTTLIYVYYILPHFAVPSTLFQAVTLWRRSVVQRVQSTTKTLPLSMTFFSGCCIIAIGYPKRTRDTWWNLCCQHGAPHSPIWGCGGHVVRKACPGIGSNMGAPFLTDVWPSLPFVWVSFMSPDSWWILSVQIQPAWHWFKQKSWSAIQPQSFRSRQQTRQKSLQGSAVLSEH